MFSFVTSALFFRRTKSADGKKKPHLNLTCLYLSVIFPDDFSSLFPPLTIFWHIPQSEMEPMLWSVILDGFYFDLFHAFSSKNSWLLPRVQNDHMRFKGMKIFCLSIVMSCSHDDSILVSFPVYRVTVNSSFDFSQKREAMTWFKINDKATCYCISSFLCKEKAVIVLNWCVRADSVKLCAMRMRTANTSGKSPQNSETSQN